MSIDIKVIVSKDDVFLDHKDISFLNYASFYDLWKKDKALLKKLAFCCDGILMSKLVSFITSREIQRLSFDLTSIAKTIFSHALRNKKSIAIIGATESENEVFVQKMIERYEGINIKVSCSGYFDNYQKQRLFDEIIEKNIDICVIGLGALKQEQFILGLREAGYSGYSFSCGGFIRQEATSDRAYYPPVFDKLNIRWLYRMYKEPHTIKRYLFIYPKSLLKIVRLSKSREIKFVT